MTGCLCGRTGGQWCVCEGGPATCVRGAQGEVKVSVRVGVGVLGGRADGWVGGWADRWAGGWAGGRGAWPDGCVIR